MSMGDPYDLGSGLKGYKALAASANKAKKIGKLKGVKGLNMPKRFPPHLMWDFDKLAQHVIHDPDFDPSEFMIDAITSLLKSKWDTMKELPVVQKHLDQCRRNND